MRRRNNNNKSKQSRIRQQALVSIGRGPYIPSSAKRVERIVTRYSGASFTNATTSGYSYFTFDSSKFTDASPWTQLAALYMFVRPIALKVTITACRATGTSDNPVVCFAPTPDGNPVASAAMNLSYFECPTGKTYTLGPGQEVSYVYKAYALQALYAPVANGYASVPAPRCSLASLPRIYFGDVMLSTPGVNIVTSANYIQVKAEYVLEFDTLDSTNIQ